MVIKKTVKTIRLTESFKSFSSDQISSAQVIIVQLMADADTAHAVHTATGTTQRVESAERSWDRSEDFGGIQLKEHGRG